MKNIFFRKYLNKAFTMVEVIIVIVILGVIASLAIPRFMGQNEKAICGEAVGLLSTLRGAQARYFLERGAYAGGDCSVLDVDLTARNFNLPPTCTAGTGAVSLTRTGGAYTVTFSIAGVFTCPLCTTMVKSACQFQ